MRRQIQTFTVLTMAIAGLFLQATTAQAEPASRRSSSSRPISNPKFDPTAERVELFTGMESGQFETKVIAMGPERGAVLVTNTTDAPLTVEFPQAFVTVQVLKQFGQGGGGFGGGGLGGGGLGGGGLGGGQGGGQQNQGGGLGGQQGGLGGGGGFGGGGQQGGGGGFFSIPPERTVRVPYVSACLNHGKPDPTPQSNRRIVPVEKYTQDPILRELIAMVGTGRLAPHAAQAAVWNRTDNMSWQQLAAKTSTGPIGNKFAYFSPNDIRGAQMISATAVARIRERGEDPSAAEKRPVASRVR